MFSIMVHVVVAWVYMNQNLMNELYTWNQCSFFYINYTSIKVILKEVIEKRNMVIKNKDAKDGVNRSLIMWKVVT